MNILFPSPLQELWSPLLAKSGIKLFLKRDDLINENVSGNKWRKLKYNISEAKSTSKSSIITFGGPFSNHIHACSALCKEEKIDLKCYVRADFQDDQNPTLNFVRSNGAEIQIISRTEYRKRNDVDFLNKIQLLHPDAYLIPEGGTNDLALKGVGEMVDEIKGQLSIDINQLFVPVGSGGTIAGIINKIDTKTKVIGISAVNDYSLPEKVIQLLEKQKCMNKNWTISFNENFGGFSKYDNSLIDYINNFNSFHNIRLDPIYTSKMLFAIEKRIKDGKIESGSTIVAIHTGGLQGIDAFNYVNGNKIL